MGVNEEIERLLGERRRELGSASRGAARADGARRVQARITSREQELLPLGLTFVRWARASRIRPTTLTSRVQNLLICTRTVPVDVGWPLESFCAASNEDRGGYGGNKRTLAVLTSVVFQWFGKNVIVSKDEAERAVAAYVVNSDSTVPWPNTSYM